MLLKIGLILLSLFSDELVTRFIVLLELSQKLGLCCGIDNLIHDLGLHTRPLEIGHQFPIFKHFGEHNHLLVDFLDVSRFSFDPLNTFFIVGLLHKPVKIHRMFQLFITLNQIFYLLILSQFPIIIKITDQFLKSSNRFFFSLLPLWRRNALGSFFSNARISDWDQGVWHVFSSFGFETVA